MVILSLLSKKKQLLVGEVVVQLFACKRVFQ